MKKLFFILVLSLGQVCFAANDYQIQNSGSYTFSDKSNPGYQVINSEQTEAIKNYADAVQKNETKSNNSPTARYTPLYTDKSADSEKPQITITDTVKLVPVRGDKPVQILEKNKQVINKKAKAQKVKRIPPIADPKIYGQYSKNK